MQPEPSIVGILFFGAVALALVVSVHRALFGDWPDHDEDDMGEDE